eukprot:CAMPEP_0119009486 /NCGR_PEP_ID=MMETSP1176-20130426/4396_1 /TAXON_ID=265551 /ORGANISM="Synedropsis recta cf, Strain CCMP1620" /LENGTH=348 /DNA_ID=CAMNT_0006962007 /DNA_START=11 /DNA_END=1057 /DNA_ORIENTATION=-
MTTTGTSCSNEKVHLQDIQCRSFLGSRDIFFSTTAASSSASSSATATAATKRSIESSKVSTSGDVLFFYPMGGNRRMLASWIDLLPTSSRLICVNRPGKGGTSAPPHHNKSDNKTTAAETTLKTALQDIIAVLDYLTIDRVSVLCLCAGSPYAMAFCAQHPERTNGHLMGISTWVEPADCGYENTTFSFYLGTHIPALASPIAGSVSNSVGTSITSLPTSWVNHALWKKLSKEEQQAFDKRQDDGQQETSFMNQMAWIQEETGGETEDVRVLLTDGLIDYHKLDETHKITLWHGSNDSMVPLLSAKWLVEEALPSAVLNVIPDGSHQGLLFGLHDSVIASTKEALGLD